MVVRTHPGKPEPDVNLVELYAKMQVPLPCLLCDGPETHRGLFVPKAQRLARAVRYSLCGACVHKPGVLHRVGERILKDLATMNRTNR